MPAKKYIVDLTSDERQILEQLTTKGKAPVYKINHARILLKADINSAQGEWTDQSISESLDISRATIERVRQRFVEQGLEAALNRQIQQRHKPRQLNGETEAHLIAMLCGPAPEGQGRWTLRLLAERIVELGYVDSVSHETVRQTLKKTNSNPG